MLRFAKRLNIDRRKDAPRNWRFMEDMQEGFATLGADLPAELQVSTIQDA